eukprot:762439-Hanusia_phi.AAC.1
MEEEDNLMIFVRYRRRKRDRDLQEELLVRQHHSLAASSQSPQECVAQAPGLEVALEQLPYGHGQGHVSGRGGEGSEED